MNDEAVETTREQDWQLTNDLSAKLREAEGELGQARFQLGETQREKREAEERAEKAEAAFRFEMTQNRSRLARIQELEAALREIGRVGVEHPAPLHPSAVLARQALAEDEA